MAIAVLAYFVYFNHRAVSDLSSHTIGNLIVEAVDGLSTPVPMDAQTGNLYVQDAKLTLPPATEQTPALLYSYYPGDESGQEELRLVDASAVRSAKVPVISGQSMESVFEAVPKLQACARGYLVVFSERTETDIPKVFQKQLRDGRTIYVYLEDACDEGKQNMLDYLWHIESY